MGVMPLEFMDGEGWESLELTGEETVSLENENPLVPKMMLTMAIEHRDGSVQKVKVVSRCDTQKEVEYFQHGGILQYVLRRQVA